MKHWNAKFLEKLLQVQDTDLKIRNLDDQIQIYYQRSKEEDSELSRLKMEIARVDETIEATGSQHQMYGTTLEDIRTAIKGLLTTKSGTPKPRTRSSTEALRIEEDKLSVLVDETQQQLQVLKDERAALVDQAEARAVELEKTQDGPEAEIRKLQQRIKRLEKQREEEVAGLPPMLLRRYDRLRSSRSGIGLTILRDGVCTVCRMQMPTAVVSRLSQGERIPMCPACGRMVARIEIVNLIGSTPEATDKPALAARSATQKLAAKKAAVKKAAVKKAAAKKAAVKKAAVKKTASGAAAEAESSTLVSTKTGASAPGSQKAAVKKTATKISEPPPKKNAAETSDVKKPTPKKAAVKKSAQKTPDLAAKKSPAKTSEAPKPAPKKSPTKTSEAPKPAPKKTAQKKPAQKKAGAADAKKAAATKSAPKKTEAKNAIPKKESVEKPADKKKDTKTSARKSSAPESPTAKKTSSKKTSTGKK
jgi:predicted  nucleic acid-binding Zn-ribbon protein